MQDAYMTYNPWFPWEKTAFEKKTSFTSKFDLNMKNKLLKISIWNRDFNGDIN